MRRLFSLLLLCSALCAAQGILAPIVGDSHPIPAVPAFVASACATSSATGAVTTSAINTTGASLIVLTLSTILGTPLLGDFTDSVGGNTYSLTTGSSGSAHIVLAYVYSPNTGSAQTFTFSLAGSYPSLCASAFKNTVGSTVDQQNGANSGGTSASSIQPGSVTPGANNEVLVTGLTFCGAATVSINGSFSTPITEPYASGVNCGAGLSYLVQGGKAAANPTWSTTAAMTLAAAIATFE